MEKKEITINIRFTSKQDLTFKITLSPENTVSDLKALCVEQSGLEVSEQRMVFKGKILKNDEDTLESLNINDGNTINLIHIKTNKAGGELNPNVLPTNYSTGGHGLLNQMGFSSSPNQTSNEMANNPFFREMMKSMLQNPQFLQSILENDPTYSRMLQEHPEIKGMLSDPTTLSMLTDPQILNSALNMANRSNGMPTGAMSGNLSNFPMPGGSDLQNNAASTNNNSNPLNNANPANPLNNANPNQRPMFNPMASPFGFNPFFNMMRNQQMGNFNQMPFPAATNNIPNPNPLLTNNNNTFQNPFFSQNTGNIAPIPINLEEKFKEQLKKLEEMGFSNKSANLEALKATNGNVEAAIERMMNLNP